MESSWRWYLGFLGLIVLITVFFLLRGGDVTRLDGPSPVEDTMAGSALDATGDPASVTISSGSFIPGAHEGSGTAVVVERDGGSRVLELRGFSTVPGPDLKVWLARDASASDPISLGELTSPKGMQSYAIPADADLSTHPYVLIWCESFSVLFTSAHLQ